MRRGLLWTQGVDQVQSVGNAPTGSINGRLDSAFNLGARTFLGEYGGLPRVRPLITWRDLTWYYHMIWYDLIWCDVRCCGMSAAHEAWSEGSASFGHHAQSETYQLHEALMITVVVKGAKQQVFPCLSRGTVRANNISYRSSITLHLHADHADTLSLIINVYCFLVHLRAFSKALLWEVPEHPLAMQSKKTNWTLRNWKVVCPTMMYLGLRNAQNLLCAETRPLLYRCQSQDMLGHRWHLAQSAFVSLDFSTVCTGCWLYLSFCSAYSKERVECDLNELKLGNQTGGWPQHVAAIPALICFFFFFCAMLPSGPLAIPMTLTRWGELRSTPPHTLYTFPILPIPSTQKVMSTQIHPFHFAPFWSILFVQVCGAKKGTI